MEAVGQTFEIGFSVRRNIPKLITGDSFQWRVRAARFADQQTRDLARQVKKTLRPSDIDNHKARRKLRFNLERRQRLAVGATRASPGGAMNVCRSDFPIVGMDPAFAGNVTGSIPSRRNVFP